MPGLRSRHDTTPESFNPITGAHGVDACPESGVPRRSMQIRHGKNDRFLFPFTGVLPPNEGPRGGDTCPPPPHFLSGYQHGRIRHGPCARHARRAAPLSRAVDRGHRRADAGRSGGPGPLRPAARERRLRRRLRRPSEGQGLALDRGAGPRAAAQPRTPRRLRMRGQHRRRRRDHGPDPGSVPAPGHRPARLYVAREGPLRHRPRLPAPRRGAARRSDRALRGTDPRRGTGGPRLARRPDRRLDARRLARAGPSRSSARSSWAPAPPPRRPPIRSPSSASST